MSGYTFRLAAVLRVRRIDATLARQNLALAVRELDAAVAQERASVDSYEAALLAPGEIGGTQFVAAREQAARLGQMLATAIGKRETLTGRLDNARSAAVSAEQRVALLERLDDRRRAEWRISVDRLDASLLDDFATIRAATQMLGAQRDD